MKVSSTHDKAEQQAKKPNTQPQTNSPLKPTLIGLALLGFGFILPFLVIISLVIFKVRNEETVVGVITISGLLYTSLAGQYLWRHRQTLPPLAMTFGLIGVACGIWFIAMVIFHHLNISFLGKYSAGDSGIVVGLSLSIMLVGQYLWRHRQTLPHSAMIAGLIGVGFGIWLIPVVIFQALGIGFLYYYDFTGMWWLSEKSGALVGLSLSILLVGQYLWRHRQTLPHSAMTAGLIGVSSGIWFIPLGIFNAIGLYFLSYYDYERFFVYEKSGAVVGLSLSILLVGQYLWRHRQTLPRSAMVVGLISIGIEAFLMLALWTGIVSFYKPSVL